MRKLNQFISNITSNKWSPIGMAILMITIMSLLVLMSSCGVQSSQYCPHKTKWSFSSLETVDTDTIDIAFCKTE